MQDTFIEMSFDEWLTTYKPILNHLDENASFQSDDGGIMFETYGDEVAFVKSQPPANIWTYGDGDCPDNTIIQIQVDESPTECDNCGVYIYNYEEDDHECE